MLKIMTMLAILLLPASVAADDYKPCLEASAAHTKTVQIVNPGGVLQTMEKPLCCCNAGGFTCCNYTIICGGYVPGCFCNKSAKPGDDVAMSFKHDEVLR